MFTILPFMVCLFWTVVFVLEWRTAHAAQRVLTVFLAVSAVLYWCHAQFFGHNGEAVALWGSVYAFCNLAVFPLYYLYIYRLTNSTAIKMGGVIALLIPAAVMFAWAVALYAMGAPQGLRLTVGRVVFLLQLLAVCWYGFKRLREFDVKIANCYSSPELRSVKQTRLLMTILLVCSFCSVVANFVGREYFGYNPELLAVPSVTFGLMLFGVGYVGLKQVFCIDSLEEEIAVDEDPEPQIDALNEKPVPRLQEQLEALMNDERLYLQSDLRLSEVAQRLGVGRTTLSAFINQTLAVSFSDYVNAFRVRHAQRLLSRDSQMRNLSMIQVSERSGFTSEASFYRAFRRHTGMTPKQWSENN